MKRLLILLAIFSVAANGCSSSTSDNVNPYPLTLAQISPMSKPAGTAFFQLQVTNTSTFNAVKGAKLTLTNAPSGHVDTVKVLSDSIGEFLFSYPWPDSVISVAFRAVKDSMVSNYLRY